MAASKKDNNGRALYPNECQRKNGTYAFHFTDSAGKRKFVYAPTLEELREKEKEHKSDELNGIDTYLAGEATLNFLFDRYISSKMDLRTRTKENYKLMYKRYVKADPGNRRIAELKFSDMVLFYQYLLDKKELLPNTVKGIHTILRPGFCVAATNAPSVGFLRIMLSRTASSNTG